MIVKFLREWRRRRAEARMIGELSSLSGPDLRDLGISRDQVRAYRQREGEV